MHAVMARPSEATVMCCSPLDIHRAVDNATHKLEQNQLLPMSSITHVVQPTISERQHQEDKQLELPSCFMQEINNGGRQPDCKPARLK
jgi:hypothetical protein